MKKLPIGLQGFKNIIENEYLYVGYLTVKKTYRKNYIQSYQLGYPNEEVRRSFVHNFLE